MDGKMLARLGAIIFVAIAITATVIEMTREDEPAQPRPAEETVAVLGRTPVPAAPHQNGGQ